MSMPGFKAEASLYGKSGHYRMRGASLSRADGISPVPTNGTGEARVVAALNPRSPLCGLLLGCCRHGVDSCCDRYFDFCMIE